MVRFRSIFFFFVDGFQQLRRNNVNGIYVLKKKKLCENYADCYYFWGVKELELCKRCKYLFFSLLVLVIQGKSWRSLKNYLISRISVYSMCSHSYILSICLLIFFPCFFRHFQNSGCYIYEHLNTRAHRSTIRFLRIDCKRNK